MIAAPCRGLSVRFQNRAGASERSANQFFLRASLRLTEHAGSRHVADRAVLEVVAAVPAQDGGGVGGAGAGFDGHDRAAGLKFTFVKSRLVFADAEARHRAEDPADGGPGDRTAE